MKSSFSIVLLKGSIAACVAIATLFGSRAKAQTYQYVLNGGTSVFSGTIGSTTFSNATWSVTSVVDMAAWTYVGSATIASAPATFNVYAGSSTFTYNLSAISGSTVTSIYAPFGPSANAYGVAPINSSGNISSPALLGLAPSANFQMSSLYTPGTYAMQVGLFGGSYLMTTQGNISFSQFNAGNGSLNISNYSPSAVPEPAEWAGLAMLGSGLGGLVVRARRRKVA